MVERRQPRGCGGDADRLPGGHSSGRRSRVCSSASGSRSSTRSTGWSFVVATVTSALLRPIPPAEGVGGLSPWPSDQGGACATSARRQALQGVYLIDINAMVFGMPRALFPAMAGAVFGGGDRRARLPLRRPRACALIGAVTTGWVANLRRQGWAVIVAVWRGGRHRAVRPGRHALGRPRPARHRRLGRRDLRRPAQHHAAERPSPSASAAACPRFRWRSSRAARASGTWSRAPWPR